MKKGFANFNSSDFNPSNPQQNSNLGNHSDHQNSSNLANQGKSNNAERKEPQINGFTSVNRQTDGFINNNQNVSSRAAYQQSNLGMSSGILNGFRNDSAQNAGYPNFSMVNVENTQYFQNPISSFGELPYSMMFNQIHSGSALNNNNSSSQAMLMTLFQIIESQSKSLQSLYDKVEKMTVKINEFGEKMKQIKKIKKQAPPQEEDIKPVIQHIGQSMQNIDSKTLIKILFGSNKLYNYKLQFMEALELPLYRERNFSISLKLTDSEGKIMKNNNKIPLSLAIYSSQNPPKFIEKNTTGQKILKGYIEQSLHFGQCRFEKIQIKQVTSHFRNGWVFIVIIPCMTPLGSANPNENFIDYLKIQPLVLEKVIVKAKKIKDAGKKGKEEKDESEMADVKDSENSIFSEKIELKENNNGDKNRIKAEQNDQQFEGIYEDK